MARFIGKYYLEKLIYEGIQAYILGSYNIQSLREKKIQDEILEHVSDIVLDDYFGENINEKELYMITKGIYTKIVRSMA